MKPDLQRIAVAEACGWKKVHSVKNYSSSWGRYSGRLWRPVLWLWGPHREPFRQDDADLLGWPDEYEPGQIDFSYGPVPDYLNRLDAMHEVEKHLRTLYPRDEFHEYGLQLEQIMIRDEEYVWHASAAQRAEAFLRTLGKWEDESHDTKNTPTD